MEDLYNEIEQSHGEVLEERKKLMTKIDLLIEEATKAKEQIGQK